MASAQSSQDMWHGRGRLPQILGNAQPRHRSESRRLSDRQGPVKTAARKRDHCPGVLHEGDPICVFSRSADKWVDGEVVKLVEGKFVRVEYEVGEYWCGKTLHLHSEHLVIPMTMSSSEDHDVGTSAAACDRATVRKEVKEREEERNARLEGALSGQYTLRHRSLRQYLSQKHINGSDWSQLPGGFDFGPDGYIHTRSGVVVNFRPIRIGGSSEGPHQVLFHYTQKRYFGMITQHKDPEGIQRSMLKASKDLSKDCDFGVGVYTTEKGPDEFHDGIKGILLNNYPRKGPWGYGGEPGEDHFSLASHCIPVIVPQCWTKSYPVTLSEPTMFGRILERKMRQGHLFDPRRHNIYVIEIPGQDDAVDVGLSFEREYRVRRLQTIASSCADEPITYARELWDFGCWLLDKFGDREGGVVKLSEACDIYEAEGATATSQYAQLLRSMGYEAERRGDYKDAMILFKKSENAFEAAGATMTVAYCNLLRTEADCLANWQESRGEFASSDEIMMLYKKADDAFKAAGATETSTYAGLCSSLGTCARYRGEYEDAMAKYEESKHLYERLGAIDNSSYACLLYDIGVWYFRDGKHHQWSKALTWYEKARHVYEAVGETDGRAYAGLLRDIGLYFDVQGDNEKAMKLLQEAEQKFEAAGATSTLVYARLLRNIGVHYQSEQKCAEADEYYEKAQAVYDKVGASLLPECIGMLQNRGCLWHSHQPTKALTLYKKARLRYEEAGLRQGDLAGCLKSMGGCLFNLERDEEALVLYQFAQELYEAIGATETPAYHRLLKELDTCKRFCARI